MNNNFYKKVNLKSRKDMIDFLSNHFRYDTMSSWNNATSYAQNLKIDRVIPHELQNKVFEMYETEDFFYPINNLLEDFDIAHNYTYQVGFNGRSGGYLVLYNGGKNQKVLFDFDNKPEKDIKEDDRDYADNYGWKSFKEVKEQGLYKKVIYQIYSQPGIGIDQHEDFSQWSNEDLKDRVKLIQQFDKLCDDIVNRVIDTAKTCEVKKEEYTVIKTRKVLVS